MNRQIAFISYETPYAPGGGLAAVMERLPQAVAHACNLRTIVISPYHHRIEKTTRLDDRLVSLGQVQVSFDRNPVTITILALEPARQWIFLKAEQLCFFAGERHPYDVKTSDLALNSDLLRDALIFGSAVAKSIALIDPGVCWTLLLQEWEAATTALAVTGIDQDLIQQTFITLHNSYDCGLPDSELERFGIKPEACPGETVLQRALPLVQKPFFTVSDQFARDLTIELLQTDVMAPHLQSLIKSNLLGVDNGVFTDCSVEPAVLAQGCRGNYAPLKEWKLANRACAVEALKALRPTPEKPVWGDLKCFLAKDHPWFVMAGRDDTRQKGYDVAVAAVERFLAGGGQAQFLFFPIPGDEGLSGLGFLRQLSLDFPESVLSLPFIFREGYFKALQAAIFGLLPSLYEPFGMANEFYLNGTPAIGRATGGLIEQIIPFPGSQVYSPGVRARIRSVYGIPPAPTGLLYREPDDLASASADWHAINDADYAKDGSQPDRVEKRSRLPLFQAMVSKLHLAIQDALMIYTQQPDIYFRMLFEGIQTIRCRFTWERAATVYARYINP